MSKQDQFYPNPLVQSWQPKGLQLEIMQCRSLATMVISANRFGKTSLGMRRIIHAARGDYPYAPLKQGNAYWVLCPSKEHFREVHKPIFDEWCPHDWLLHFDNRDLRATIRRHDDTEATIKWWSYEQDAGKLVGKGVDGVWLDEPAPRDHYRKAWAHLAEKCGWIWFTMTPIDGIGWWGKEIYEPANRGEGPWKIFHAALATRDDDNPEEFCVGRPLVPHLNREQLVWFASAYHSDEDELAIRIFGEVRSR